MLMELFSGLSAEGMFSGVSWSSQPRKVGARGLGALHLDETELLWAARALEGLPKNAQHAMIVKDLEAEYHYRIRDVENFASKEEHVAFKREMDARMKRANEGTISTGSMWCKDHHNGQYCVAV